MNDMDGKTMYEDLVQELTRFGRSTDDIMFVYAYPYNEWFHPAPEELPYLMDTAEFLDELKTIPYRKNMLQVLILGVGFVCTHEYEDPVQERGVWRCLPYDRTSPVRNPLTDTEDIV